MKKVVLTALTLAALVFTGCSSDDDVALNPNGGGNPDGGTSGDGIITSTDDEDFKPSDLKGDVNGNIKLVAGTEYTLTGPLRIKEGTTLEIEAGTTIKATAGGSDVFVAIERGAKIEAIGTASAPITFTSSASNPRSGDWGGIVIAGKAPSNVGADAQTEVAGLKYGGTVADDNSGTLRYVRVEYSGGKADGQSENNGFSFYGVGNGTTVEYIQMFEGKDDGVEFFGGTVNVNNVSIVNAEDDSIDWTEGYSGTITDAYVKHGTDHDKGIEADGYNTDIGNLSDPKFFSKPTVTHLTIEGLGSGTANEAIRLRAGTQGIFNNVLLIGFAEGFDLDGDATDNPTGNGVTSGDLKATDVKFEDVTVKVKNDTGVAFTTADFMTENAAATGTDYATWGAGWTRE